MLVEYSYKSVAVFFLHIFSLQAKNLLDPEKFLEVKRQVYNRFLSAGENMVNDV